MTKSESLKPRRQLGLFDATMIVMGGIVGAGIFANPSEVAHRVHTPFLILGVWVLGGLLAICGAFIWAELATRLPGTGGQYLYLREAYHPAVAFVYGWGLLLVTQTGGMAAVAVIFASYFRSLTGVAWNDSEIAAVVLLSANWNKLSGSARRQQCAERFYAFTYRGYRGTRDPGICARRKLTEIGTIVRTTGFVWAFEERWICHGPRRVCVWRMADCDLRRR